MASSTDLVPLYPSGLLPLAPFENYIVFEHVPVVVDASALINDCLRYVKRGHEPLLFHIARDLGAVNLYATTVVRAEVEERLPRAVETVGLPLAPVERVWRDELRPLVNFVEAGALEPSSDPRALELALRDPPDLPTVALAELLGPCLVFGTDRDIVDLGIARDDWANLLLHARDVSTYQTGVSLGALSAVVTVGSLVELSRLVIAATKRWPLFALATAAAGGYALHAYWQSERGTGQRREARSLAVTTGRELAGFLARASDARDLLERAAFVPEYEPTPLAGVARVVAAAPRPLRPSEIAPHVGFSTQRVTSLLQQPVFHRTSEGYYLLGLRG